MPDGSGTWEKGSLKSTFDWTLGLTLVSSMPDGSGTWETGLKPILDRPGDFFCGGGLDKLKLLSNLVICYLRVKYNLQFV